MPTNYDGKPGNITTESPLTVTGASNTNPITITVSGALPAEFYVSGGLGGTPAGPQVRISGIDGNTSANGIWIATPTGASTFTIPVAGIGAYSGLGGIAQPLYLKSMYTAPSDGDSANEASIDTWIRAGGDRSQFLAARVGTYKLAKRTAILFDSVTGVPWASQPGGVLTAGTLAQWTTAGAFTWTVQAGVSADVFATPVAGQPPVFGIHGCITGDVAMVRLDTSDSSSATAYRVGLMQVQQSPQAPTPGFGLYGRLFGSFRTLDTVPANSISLAGIINIGFSGDLYIQPVIYPLSSGAQAQTLRDDVLLTVEFWRATGMPQ
jgi:hypothetical protein